MDAHLDGSILKVVVYWSNVQQQVHWRRLVKNIGWANQNIGGKGGKKWQMHGRFSIIYEARARAAPQVYAYEQVFCWRSDGVSSHCV